MTSIVLCKLFFIIIVALFFVVFLLLKCQDKTIFFRIYRYYIILSFKIFILFLAFHSCLCF